MLCLASKHVLGVNSFHNSSPVQWCFSQGNGRIYLIQPSLTAIGNSFHSMYFSDGLVVKTLGCGPDAQVRILVEAFIIFDIYFVTYFCCLMWYPSVFDSEYYI